MPVRSLNKRAKISPELPDIPSKRYFTIGEVSGLCDVAPHILRYWEQEFPPLKPSKRRGNRRYYQRQDVVLVRTIRSLLYDEGYTISGARQRLGTGVPDPISRAVNLRDVRLELEQVLDLLE
ncbi:MAG: MerR family transcriptional regulator [Gammaproteobacteria bacterium]|nr:MerR family transcriptional regulator [Gammaproteobacteria bacterium]